MLADLVAFAMLGALILYALMGGADFGGGVWDLLASGSRAREQRALVARSIGPIWEANHVWLILVVVLLFTGFPLAFSVASIALHIPLTLMLLGIVARGAAFSFRHHGTHTEVGRRTWGWTFAVASTITPLFLGIVMGAITGEGIRVSGGMPTTGFLRPWIAPFPLLVGLFTLALFAYLAAVYLTTETTAPPLQEDFRRRAIAAAVAVAALAGAAALAGDHGAPRFHARLFGSWWTPPLVIATAVSGIGAIESLRRRRYTLAQPFAVAQVALMLSGWGLAQRPHLIAPDVTIRGAAAPDLTHELLLLALALGSILLFPSLYVLFRIFKAGR